MNKFIRPNVNSTRRKLLKFSTRMLSARIDDLHRHTPVSPLPSRAGRGKGRLLSPLNAAKASSSITPALPSALASFAHLLLSGKNAWQMQNVRPS
jgi:hypothetical protein